MDHPRKLAKLQDDVTFWREQGHNNERDRRNIIKVAVAGGAASLLLAAWRPLWAAGGVAFFSMLYLMGMYMTWVRRGEFRDSVSEAQQNLARVAPPAPPQPAPPPSVGRSPEA